VPRRGATSRRCARRTEVCRLTPPERTYFGMSAFFVRARIHLWPDRDRLRQRRRDSDTSCLRRCSRYLGRMLTNYINKRTDAEAAEEASFEAGQ
jgi:hypothetical protein